MLVSQVAPQWAGTGGKGDRLPFAGLRLKWSSEDTELDRGTKTGLVSQPPRGADSPQEESVPLGSPRTPYGPEEQFRWTAREQNRRGGGGAGSRGHMDGSGGQCAGSPGRAQAGAAQGGRGGGGGSLGRTRFCILQFLWKLHTAVMTENTPRRANYEHVAGSGQGGVTGRGLGRPRRVLKGAWWWGPAACRGTGAPSQMRTRLGAGSCESHRAGQQPWSLPGSWGWGSPTGADVQVAPGSLPSSCPAPRGHQSL